MQCFEAWSSYWKDFGARRISRARGKSIFNGMDRDMVRARAQAKARGAARATGRAGPAKICRPTTLGKLGLKASWRSLEKNCRRALGA